MSISGDGDGNVATDDDNDGVVDPAADTGFRLNDAD